MADNNAFGFFFGENNKHWLANQAHQNKKDNHFDGIPEFQITLRGSNVKSKGESIQA